MSKYVVVKLGKEEYAVNIDYVNSIENVSTITPTPKSPSFVLGYLEYRGKVRLVFDFKGYLNGQNCDVTDATKIMFINLGGEDGKQIGLLVDEATEVLEIEDELLGADNGSLQLKSYMKVANLTNRIIVILDVVELFSEDVKKVEDEESVEAK